MGEARFDTEFSFEQQAYEAAAVICRTNAGNLHAGVYFRSDEGVGILHLGSPDHLYVNHWTWSRLWAVPACEPEQLFHVAATCRLVIQRFKAEKTMPYGIGLGGSSFATDGKLRLAPGASGLTCATFILASFRSATIELVDESSWPVRKDEDNEFLALLEKFGVDHANLERMRREVELGVKRIWPDEVIGACACTLPAKFDAARAAADTVVERLKAVEADTP